MSRLSQQRIGDEKSDTITELQNQVKLFEQECSLLRCTLILNDSTKVSKQSGSSTYLERELQIWDLPGSFHISSTPDSDSFSFYSDQLQSQQDDLQKEITRLREDNDSLYESIYALSAENNSCRQKLDSIKEEVDMYKQLIDFLITQRDELKKGLAVQDEKLLEYRNIFSCNRDVMVRVQNPLGCHNDLQNSPDTNGYTSLLTNKINKSQADPFNNWFSRRNQ